jgi:hypothetical protein
MNGANPLIQCEPKPDGRNCEDDNSDPEFNAYAVSTSLSRWFPRLLVQVFSGSEAPVS